jgi:hypothetical protein
MKSFSRNILYLLAFAWPFDIYQTIFPYGIRLDLGAVLLLVIPFGNSLYRGQKFRAPLEFIWPPALMLCLLSFAGVSGESSVMTRPFAYALCFWITLHLVDSRKCITRCLFLSGLGGAIAALLTLLSSAGLIFPTAFSLDTTAQLAFANTLSSGLLTLVWTCVVMATLGMVKTLPKTTRITAWTGAALCATCLCLLLRQGAPGLFPPQPIHWKSTHGLVVLVYSWFILRITAKTIVARMEDRPGMHLPLILLSVILLFSFLIVLPDLPIGHAFLLALLASYALPSTTRQNEIQTLAKWPLIPVLALLVFNLSHIHPRATTDPRNYDYQASVLYGGGDTQQLLNYLERVDELAPREHRTNLWRARAHLQQNQPDQTADALIDALGHARAPLLPDPSQAETNALLIELRDHVSALPEEERGLAYERALVALGQQTNALDLLKQRAPMAIPEQVSKNMPASHDLARDLAQKLGDPHLAETLEKWSMARLYTLLYPAPSGKN